MSILVVGSVALDSVETPFGKVDSVLGGSCIYFSAAASLFTDVRLVGVVGQDYDLDALGFLRERGADLRGLQVAEGRTFRWSGRYDYDLNVTHTLDTQLNVFADFHPVLPPGFAESDIAFLANIDPSLQFEVLSQVRGAKLTMMDTMNFWIQGQREALTKTIQKVDVVTMNESEVRMFAGASSLLAAARKVLDLGPKALIVKQGEYGAIMFGKDGYFMAPAYPLEEVWDPTGAGDSFAGGFLGFLDQVGSLDVRTLRQAIIVGSAVASFTVGGFSLDRLRSLTRAEVDARVREFQSFTQFETL